MLMVGWNTLYISTALLPGIDEVGSNEEFAAKGAVALIVNCSVHVRPETLQLLADPQVKVMTFPPHTNHIFYGLDLSLFGNINKKMNSKFPLESDKTTAGFLTHIFHMMKQALAENNVRSAFMQLGLRSDVDASHSFLRFDQ
jgi:hypothetical protein